MDADEPARSVNGFFCAGLSAAHYLPGAYNEAVKWARQAVQLRPGMPAGHRMLCASLAQAGLIDEARSAMAYLRKLQPTLSVAWSSNRCRTRRGRWLCSLTACARPD